MIQHVNSVMYTERQAKITCMLSRGFGHDWAKILSLQEAVKILTTQGVNAFVPACEAANKADAEYYGSVPYVWDCACPLTDFRSDDNTIQWAVRPGGGFRVSVYLAPLHPQGPFRKMAEFVGTNTEVYAYVSGNIPQVLSWGQDWHSGMGGAAPVSGARKWLTLDKDVWEALPTCWLPSHEQNSEVRNRPAWKAIAKVCTALDLPLLPFIPQSTLRR